MRRPIIEWKTQALAETAEIHFVVLRLVLGSVWLGRKLGRGSCSLRC